MRLVHGIVAAAALSAAALFVAPNAAAGGAPTVYSVVEGRDSQTGKQVVVLVGDKLTAVSQYNIADQQGLLVGALTLRLKTKNTLVFALPDGLPEATYRLTLFWGKGLSGTSEHQVVVTNFKVAPAAVIGASLSPALRTDLDDAATLNGHPGSWYVDVANLTGSLDPALFSAYDDLTAEGKVGAAAGQLAAGDHNHDSAYVLRGGDTLTGANLAVSASSGDAVSGASSSDSGYGVAGTNTATSGTGLYGSSSGTSGRGVFGDATSGTGTVSGVHGRTASPDGRGVFGEATATTGTAAGVEGSSRAQLGVGVRGLASAADGVGVFGDATSSSGTCIGVFGRATQSGNGIGVYGTGSSMGVYADGSDSGTGVVAAGNTGTAISASSETGLALDAGTRGSNVAVFNNSNTGSGTYNLSIWQFRGANKARIDSNGRGYFNNGTVNSGADFAESVAVAGRPADYEPGDVLVIDAAGTRRFARSSERESALVAGVYSTRPGVLARPGDVAGDVVGDTAGAGDWANAEVPLAIAGIVPCKVCDEGGAIRAGDLLVTSSVPGHAMRAPADPRPGTIVGKALGSLPSGRGKIEVLLR